MKKKVMNIRPQEVTEGGERSVQYKGSDGKMHGIAPAGSGGSTAQSATAEPIFIVTVRENETVQKVVNGESVECDKSELCEAVVNNPFTKILMVNGMWKFQLHLVEYNDVSDIHSWLYRAIFNDADASVEIRLENGVWSVKGRWSA